MASPSQTHIPYQAYKPKRHSRNLSNSHLIRNASPPPTSRPPSATPGSPGLIAQIISPSEILPEQEKLDIRPPQVSEIAFKQEIESTPKVDRPEPVSPTTQTNGLTSVSEPIIDVAELDQQPQASPPTAIFPPRKSISESNRTTDDSSQPSSSSSSPAPAALPTAANGPRKSSTFRRVPVNGSGKARLPSSPLRPPETHTRRLSTSSNTSLPPKRLGEPTVSPVVLNERPLPATPPEPSLPNPHAIQASQRAQFSDPQLSNEPFTPPPRSHSLKGPSKSSGASSTSSSTPASPAALLPSVPAAPRPSAPYRPGFQPKGVYRLRTDEFNEARKLQRDIGRVERTKLERRLEKLINLHFSREEKKIPDVTQLPINRRMSSFFDLDFSDLKNMDAGNLWRGVIQSQAFQGAKADIRAAEQRITPWQDDADVSKCPLCTSSFHPLTNRKHHCRLCGKIICSLPVKHPQRPVTCSLLFVVDPQTRRIEEVGEGVDYGVRKRRSPFPPGKGKEREELSDDEKFLKGVRICRECHPILSRQQYQQETTQIPQFIKLYEVFTTLEQEIEDALPQFQELILSLSNDDQPTKEASAARKRLLEAFAQYDALSKRIRKLPCPNGQGSSQDRVQMAILTRANLFLQKNMFPLQSLPKPRPQDKGRADPSGESSLIDPDSELAYALQPLLEQEALLESFVDEAKTHRKFEDAKTLKANLAEIRVEIDKIIANAEGGMKD